MRQVKDYLAISKISFNLFKTNNTNRTDKDGLPYQSIFHLCSNHFRLHALLSWSTDALKYFSRSFLKVFEKLFKISK